MLDIRYVRDNPGKVREGIRAKQMPEALEALEQLLLADEEERLLRRDLEAAQARRNTVSREIGELKRQGSDASGPMAEMAELATEVRQLEERSRDRKSTRLNSSHVAISYAVFCLKKKK